MPITKELLSGSTSGRPVAVAATSTPGTTIHTAVNTTDWSDEVWLYVTNVDTSAVDLTLELGGTSTSDTVEMSIPAEDGLHLVLPGHVFDTGVVIKAFAGTTNVLNICGWVNRLDQS
jgi:hypothetical protein